MLVVTAKGRQVEIPQKAVDTHTLDRVWNGEKLDDGTELISITYSPNPRKKPVILGRYTASHAEEELNHVRFNLVTGRMDVYRMPPDDDYNDG